MSAHESLILEAIRAAGSGGLTAAELVRLDLFADAIAAHNGLTGLLKGHQVETTRRDDRRIAYRIPQPKTPTDQ